MSLPKVKLNDHHFVSLPHMTVGMTLRKVIKFTKTAQSLLGLTSSINCFRKYSNKKYWSKISETAPPH